MVEIGPVVLFMVLLEFNTGDCIILGFLDVFGQTGAALQFSGEISSSEGQADHRNVLPVAAENTLAKAISQFLNTLT